MGPDISENSDDEEWNFEHRQRSNLASIKKHCENSQSPKQLSQTLNHSISCLQKERDQLMEKFEKCRDKYKKAEILHRSYKREKERALEEYNSAYSEGKNVKGKNDDLAAKNKNLQEGIEKCLRQNEKLKKCLVNLKSEKNKLSSQTEKEKKEITKLREKLEQSK